MESNHVAAQLGRFVVGVALISVICFLLFGCAHMPKGPPAVPPVVPLADMCIETDPRPSPGSCGTMETNHGTNGPHYRCVVCGDIVEPNGCVTTNFEYCTAPELACDDPVCK